MGKGGRTGGNKSSEEALSGVYEGPGSPLQLDCGILEGRKLAFPGPSAWRDSGNTPPGSHEPAPCPVIVDLCSEGCFCKRLSSVCF